jgi:hypothetical protein
LRVKSTKVYFRGLFGDRSYLKGVKWTISNKKGLACLVVVNHGVTFQKHIMNRCSISGLRFIEIKKDWLSS